MKFQPTASEPGSGFCIGRGCDTPYCNDCIRPVDEDFYLSDVSPRDKTWDERKQDSQRVRSLYKGTVFDCYAGRIDGCSGFLEFDWITDAQGETTLKLKSARFCRVRFCPICQWRKALMWVARFLKAVPAIVTDHPSARFIFLTLTVPNCPLNELKQTLVHMNKSWHRLIDRKQFPAIGFAKSFEVTRKKHGMVHPHFHCLLMVKSTYFNRDYMTQADWTQLWKECLKADYTPVVNVKAIKPKKGRSASSSPISIELDALSAAVVETFKYSVKPDDLIGEGYTHEENQEWLVEITNQLHKTRSISLGGVFKDYLSEAEPEDLIHADLEQEEVSGELSQVWFGWREMVRRYVKHN